MLTKDRSNTKWAKRFHITFIGNDWHSDMQCIQNVVDWLQKQNSNSEASKELFFIWINAFCNFAHLEPDQLIQLKRKEIEQLFVSYFNARLNNGIFGRSVNSEMCHVKSLFTQNGFDEIRLPHAFAPIGARKKREYVPSVSEALQMANIAGFGTRDYVIILMLAFTGLRISTLVALWYGWVKKELESNICPLLIIVDDRLKARNANADKGRNAHYTFASLLVIEGLKEYLRRRKEYFGISEIPYMAPLLCSMSRKIDKEKRNLTELSPREIEDIVKKYARLAGFEGWQYVRAHSLRKTFRSFLRKQPEFTGVKDDMIAFWMGHKYCLDPLDIPYLDHEKREELRSIFAKFEVEDNPLLCLMRHTVKLVKLDPYELRDSLKLKLGREPTSKEEIHELAQKIGQKFARQKKRTQRIEAKETAMKLINGGWLYVDKVDENTWIIEKEVEVEESS